MKNSGLTLVLSPLLLVFSACIKEDYNPNKLVGTYSPEVAIPLAHSVITVDDLLDPEGDSSDDLIVDANGMMILFYKTSKQTPAAKDYISFSSGPLIQPFITPSISTPIIADSINLNLELFNKVNDGSFYFEDPKLHITFQNSFGTPVQINLTRLEAWSSGTGLIPIELNDNSGTPMMQPNILLTPGYSTTPGQTTTTVYSWDKTNSNLSALVSDSVANRYIYYTAKGLINPPPPGIPPPVNSFITDSSTFDMEVELELPLYGRGEYVVLGDTVPFNMDINEPTGSPINATEATLVINTYNGFPIAALMQIAFLDSADSVITTLFADDQKEIISSATVGPAPSLKVIAPSHKITEITINKERLDLFAMANRIIVTGSLTTTGGSGDALVKIYSGYYIEIKLAARAVLSLQ